MLLERTSKRAGGFIAVAAFLLPLLAAPRATAKWLPCDPAGSDGDSIAAARAAIDAACPCESSSTAGNHARCALQVIRGLVDAGSLRGACRGNVQRCALGSTCGRRGAVACCVTSPSGARRAAIARNAGLCRAPRGGFVEVPDSTSICDACLGAGPTPTPAPVVTPTPLPPPRATCGNGKIEPGERCDGGPLCVNCAIVVPVCCSYASSYCASTAPSSVGELAAALQQCRAVDGTLLGLSDCQPTQGGVPHPTGFCGPAAFGAVSLCCEGAPGGSCLSFRGDDPMKLADFVSSCWGLSGGSGRPLPSGTIVQGTCGVTGRCVRSPL